MVKYKQLSFEERVQIELLKRSGVSVRGIATVLGRSPNTVSRELKEKLVGGVYLPKKAHHKTYYRRYLSKWQCLKVSKNPYLAKDERDTPGIDRSGVMAESILNIVRRY